MKSQLRELAEQMTSDILRAYHGKITVTDALKVTAEERTQALGAAYDVAEKCLNIFGKTLLKVGRE